MRILLIEDEQQLAESLMRGLEQSGYVIDHLAEGAPAIDRFSMYRNEYDIAILDLMLPDVDGHTICKSVRSAGVTLPILVLTARGEVEDKVTLLQSGADDYMVKPFAFNELLARLQALLRRPNETVPNVLTVGQFTLNTATHKIFHFEEELSLTLKEFMLLEYFMRHPNQAIARDDIIDHAWNFDFDSLSNTVDVHIKNVRKKIGPDGNKIIKTIRGVGYQFVE
jgi:DNA-binding response OmpR family regulator